MQARPEHEAQSENPAHRARGPEGRECNERSIYQFSVLWRVSAGREGVMELNESLIICLLLVAVFLTVIILMDRLMWSAYSLWNWWRTRKQKGMIGRAL